MIALDERPWEALPAEVADVVRPELPALADEIIAAISEAVPDYARPLEGTFGQALRIGVEEALRQFVSLIEGPAGGAEARSEVYLNLGRAEMRAGRSLDALQAAYRVGARVAWRRLARAGVGAALAPETLYILAEAIFAYIDGLSAESVEGYAREQAAVAGRVQRARRRLAALLVQEPPADALAIEALAAEAAWRLPDALAAVAVEPAAEQGDDGLARRAAPDWLFAPEGGAADCLIVPDPAAPGRAGQVAAAAAGRSAAVGPAVPWREAALSFGRALATLRLAEEGIVSLGDGLLQADDHAVALLLHGDRRLGGELAARLLAPLGGETAASRERLAETLYAWLRHGGRTEAVARSLHVHPQTVRYRVARLRELFGDKVDDADARFELELALRLARSASTTRADRRPPPPARLPPRARRSPPTSRSPRRPRA